MPTVSQFVFWLYFCVLSAGYSVFAIGVADVDFVELQEIGSKPSDRHVFVVDDFDAFNTIKENLITFICETATSSKFARYHLQQNSQENVLRFCRWISGKMSWMSPFLVPQRVPWFSWMDSLHLVSKRWLWGYFGETEIYHLPRTEFTAAALFLNSSVRSSLLICCVSGFRMLEAFNLTEKTYSYVKGVSMEPGSFNSYTAYRLHKNAFLTQPTTWV